MVLSVPIAFALGISSVVTLIFTEKMPLNFIAQGMLTTVDSYSLIAVAMFFVGDVTGGLAAVSMIACTIFAALSGSGPATVAAIGGIMVPAMANEKYDIGFSSGVVASAGTLGIIIPPSIPLIIYGI